MKQLPLSFQSPIPRVWIQTATRPGRTIRRLRVKSFDGQRAVVVPLNFVHDKWPWTGRAVGLDELKQNFAPITRG